MKIRRKKDRLVEQEQQRQDLGFGTKITDNNTRLLNKNGSFNVKRLGMPFSERLNLYHRLITMPWLEFNLLLVWIFVIVNCIFAILYIIIGIENLVGIDMANLHSQFWDAFFFSAQTLTTVGYGRIAPIGFEASLVAAIESLMGLLAFALATGLLYGRFSRPKAHISFSTVALVSPYLDTRGLMFRIVNKRDTQLIDLDVSVTLSMLETLANGSRTRKYFALALERHKVNFFPVSWTIVHPLTTESPLYGLSHEVLLGADAELLIQIRGTDDTFFQQVHTRSSYHASEFVFGAKFKSMYVDNQSNIVELDLNKLSHYDKIDFLPEIEIEKEQTAEE